MWSRIWGKVGISGNGRVRGRVKDMIRGRLRGRGWLGLDAWLDLGAGFWLG